QRLIAGWLIGVRTKVRSAFLCGSLVLIHRRNSDGSRGQSRQGLARLSRMQSTARDHSENRGLRLLAERASSINQRDGVREVNPKTGKVLGADEETDGPLRDVKKARGCYSQGFRTKQGAASSFLGAERVINGSLPRCDPSKGKEQEMVAALHRYGATRI